MIPPPKNLICAYRCGLGQKGQFKLALRTLPLCVNVGSLGLEVVHFDQGSSNSPSHISFLFRHELGTCDQVERSLCIATQISFVSGSSFAHRI